MFNQKAFLVELTHRTAELSLKLQAEIRNTKDALSELDLCRVRLATVKMEKEQLLVQQATLQGRVGELQKKLEDLQPKFDHVRVYTKEDDIGFWVPEGEGERVSDSVYRQITHGSSLVSVNTEDRDVSFPASDFKRISVQYGIRKPPSMSAPGAAMISGSYC